MKILWLKTDFLHPTTRGGQIRTLEMLRQLHRRHEIHYAAFEDQDQPEGYDRAGEYSTYAYRIPGRIHDKQSLRFLGELAVGWVARLPVAVRRYQSPDMRRVLEDLTSRHQFDAKICDFPFPGINIPEMDGWVLFQHNVETMIWRRHVAAAADPLSRWYLNLQARRMFEFERSMCLRAKKVIAVSEGDAELMRKEFQVKSIAAVPTGVDTEYFARPESPSAMADLVFVGSMDWMANIDGMSWFLDEILPRIRKRRPDCSVAIVGRDPAPKFVARAAREKGVIVTGTVPDVRPYLWGSLVSIVPLRIGSGTRLKIFEAMSAGCPVVSTTVGAEGLPVENGRTVLLADTAECFAQGCLTLLEDADRRSRIAANAHEMVRSCYGWEGATLEFERLLLS
jgi:glycosyltransferase involved in cell wall biosynthesis